MAALSNTNYIRPPYTATIILELYSYTNQSRDNNTEYAVAIGYKNETDRDPFPWNVTGASIDHDTQLTLNSIFLDNL